MKIIGISGLDRSGKDTLAEYLISQKYFGFSFGDFTRKHSRERHKNEPDPISVANMTETSNWLREKYGPDVILQSALKEFKTVQDEGKKYKGLVLFSVRAPVEVDWILTHDGQLVWVEASDKIRYERTIKNIRQGEQPISFKEFLAQQKLQWQPQPSIPVEVQMDLGYVKDHATIVIDNEGSDLNKFLNAAKKTLKEASLL